MKIAICGSMRFAAQMLELEAELKRLGHEVVLPLDTKECVENPNLNRDIGFCIDNDIIRDHLRKIQECDAILVMNLAKNNVRGYVGASTLIEMGFAHFLGKKIFLFDRIPKIPCRIEIRAMEPTILYGDLSQIDDKPDIESPFNSNKHYQQIFLSIKAEVAMAGKHVANRKSVNHKNSTLLQYA